MEIFPTYLQDKHMSTEPLSQLPCPPCNFIYISFMAKGIKHFFNAFIVHLSFFWKFPLNSVFHSLIE